MASPLYVILVSQMHLFFGTLFQYICIPACNAGANDACEYRLGAFEYIFSPNRCIHCILSFFLTIVYVRIAVFAKYLRPFPRENCREIWISIGRLGDPAEKNVSGSQMELRKIFSSNKKKVEPGGGCTC
jgi:hypothetical protein